MICARRSELKSAQGTLVFMNPPFRYLLCVFILSCSCCGPVESGNPSLELITPSVGTRGSAFAVTAKGASIKEVHRMLFYGTGVRCERVEAVTDEEAVLHLVADADCSLGPHPFRLLGDNGFSEMRTLTISPFPTVQEDSETEKQFVNGNSTVLGTLESDDVDTYQVQVKSGQRISAEAVGVRLGVSLLDTTLTLRDPSGRILKRVDDTPMLNQDPSFSILAPEDGTYSIEITTAGANADADSQYALHLGNFPRPYRVFPLGAQAGTEADVTFTSSDTDSSDSFQQRIQFDSGLVGTRYIELKENWAVCPTPIPFRIGPHAQVCNEVSLPNSVVGSGVDLDLKGSTRPRLMAPGAMHGVIGQTGEIDTFGFSVHQPGVVTLEVFASRLGSLLDAVVEVRDPEDRVISNGDDFDSHDSKLVFETKADTAYTVSIRDKRKNSGPAYSYCIEVQPLQPTVSAFLPRRNKLSQVGQTISVPIGNRTLAFMAVRRDRMDGDVVLNFDGLPGGVSIDCPSIADTAFVVPAVFATSASSSMSGSLVAVNTALKSGTTLNAGGFEQTVDLVNGPADSIFQLTHVDRLAVATVHPVPYTIEIVKPTASLPADGTLDIGIQVRREAGFEGPIDITLPLLPEWVDCQAKTRIPAAQNSGTITLRAHRVARAGNSPLVAEGVAGLEESSSGAGDSAMGTRTRRQSAVSLIQVCSSLHTLAISDSPVHGKIDSVSAEQGSEIELVCRLEASDSVPEKLVATLEDLPNRVYAKSVQITNADKEVKFHLQIDKDAPLGTFDSVVCRLSGTMDDQKISYCVARNTRLIISSPGTSQKDELGRPISPLEALRRRKTKQGS